MGQARRQMRLRKHGGFLRGSVAARASLAVGVEWYYYFLCPPGSGGGRTLSVAAYSGRGEGEKRGWNKL